MATLRASFFERNRDSDTLNKRAKLPSAPFLSTSAMRRVDLRNGSQRKQGRMTSLCRLRELPIPFLRQARMKFLCRNGVIDPIFEFLPGRVALPNFQMRGDLLLIEVFVLDSALIGVDQQTTNRHRQQEAIYHGVFAKLSHGCLHLLPTIGAFQFHHILSIMRMLLRNCYFGKDDFRLGEGQFEGGGQYGRKRSKAVCDHIVTDRF